MAEWQTDAGCGLSLAFYAIQVKIGDEGSSGTKPSTSRSPFCRQEGGSRLDRADLKGAKFWLRVMNELILAVGDRRQLPEGLARAINGVFPQTLVQTLHRA